MNASLRFGSKLFTIGLVKLLFLSEGSLLAQRFVEINVEIELISYPLANPKAPPDGSRRTYRARCIVGTNEWHIENDFILNAKESWHFDGTNVCRRQEITRTLGETGASNQPSFKPVRPMVGSTTVTIVESADGHPLGNLGVNIPWLAFCSAPFLSKPNRIIPLPTLEVLRAPYVFGYEDKTELEGGDFPLPKRVELLTSKELMSRSPKDPRLLRYKEVVRASASVGTVPDGQLKFKYQATAFTNFGGWRIPGHFEYTTFQPAQGNDDWRPFVGGVGRLLSVVESPPPPSVITGGDRQTFVDFRFRNPSNLVDGIIFRSNTTTLPATNDPSLLAQFARASTHAAKVATLPDQRAIPFVFGAVITVTGIIFGVLIWQAHRK